MGWFIVDGHEDIAMALAESQDRDFGRPAPPNQALSLPDAKRGELAVIIGTIFAPEGYWPGQTALQAADSQMRCYEDLLEKFDEDLFRVESRGDLALCKAGGPIGLLHLMEGADPIRSPRDVRRWMDRGVRVIAPVWNTGNRYCGSRSEGTGLSDAGRALIAEMRRLQVLPDISHMTPLAVDDLLSLDNGVVIASHSNARALHDHPRNLSDEHIREVAARGGLVGIVLFNPFLGSNGVTLDTVIAHIEHIFDLVGPQHVGIGSDLDGGFGTSDTPTGIDNVADLRLIGEALLARGHGTAVAEDVLGGNWMRVLREALPD
jgi:membrane dipeptidase